MEFFIKAESGKTLTVRGLKIDFVGDNDKNVVVTTKTFKKVVPEGTVLRLWKIGFMHSISVASYLDLEKDPDIL